MRISQKAYFLIILLHISKIAFSQSVNTLWYNKPATYFEESLVLGNGKNGAAVFGGILSDQIYLNDATLWSGEPVNPQMNPEAYKHIPEIREALFNEDYKTAENLNKKIQGKFSESYAPLGTLHINFKHNGDFQNYRRELSLNDAVAKVSYDIDGVSYSREYFISHPDKIMVIKLSCNNNSSLKMLITN